MSVRGYFITGTDTGVGKTRVACDLIHRMRGQGHRVAGMKPVASGCRVTPEGPRSEDAEALAAADGAGLPYDWVNPYALRLPTAPHLAAQAQGIAIDPAVILSAYRRLAEQAEVVVVEGIGGWQVPLAPGYGLPQLAAQLGLPVIVVVAVRLGAINHAVLTCDAIRASGLPIHGWVANRPSPETTDTDSGLEGYEQAIGDALALSCLAHFPFRP